MLRTSVNVFSGGSAQISTPERHRPCVGLVLLRIASVVSLLFAAGHTSGSLQSWSPAGETDVLQSMRSFHFDASGASRTYLDFYMGFGFIISIYFVLQGVLIWQIATLASTDPRRARPLIATFAVAVVLTTLVCWKFIFAVPVIFGAVIAACLGSALFAIGRQSKTAPRVAGSWD